jgi:inner membrane protein
MVNQKRRDLDASALLVGAIASFLAVAAVMYFTRGLDWYGSLPTEEPAGGRQIASAEPS